MHLSGLFTPIPGEGMLQIKELGLAFFLSALIGLEREYRQKAAGFRTYTLVGVSAALFMLISKYGFEDVLLPDRVVVDPSRVAAQIVSGLGFIGGGVIFMRRDTVRGLTTAASVWLTAAIGMACGAGMAGIAVLTTLGYLLIMFLTPAWLLRLPRAPRHGFKVIIRGDSDVDFVDTVYQTLTRLGFTLGHVWQERKEEDSVQLLRLHVHGIKPAEEVISALMRIPGVQAAGSEKPDEAAD
ncbi:MgtC/SapB family protein [Asaia krungthepensis]|uniref:Protein MgtC n=1 Tax=Asaia krungthepensis NRIC 0535 TaxID=1307925 RepID=A0ABQ0PWN8_9PROT|nr:MgtC/SapB family protein [Asaia krungthepensis]GBQ83427.1 cation transporter MgtC/SapB [Asaia krungthepensis NRIC 0535]